MERLANFIIKLYLFISAFALGQAYAQNGPASLNLSGSLFNADGTTVTNASVNFKIQIYDAAGTCVLFSEEHLGQDLSSSKGGFALQVGAGSSQTNFLEGTANYDLKLYVNSGVVAGFSGCVTGVTMNPGAARVVRVSYDLGAGYVAMSPDVPLTNTPFAMIADTLQGLTPTDLIQVRSDASNDLTQANVQTVFNSTNFPKLTSLLNGNSTQYMPAAPSAPLDMNGQRLTNLATPTAASDAVTKNYADSDLAGLAVNITGVGAGVGGGKTLVWDQVANKWEAQLAGTVTSVNSGAGLIGGPITTNGTLSVDVGTAANQIMQLNASALAPAVDGSLLFNVNASRLSGRTVSSTAPTSGQILTYNSTSLKWEAATNAGITALTGDVVADRPRICQRHDSTEYCDFRKNQQLLCREPLVDHRRLDRFNRWL